MADCSGVAARASTRSVKQLSAGGAGLGARARNVRTVFVAMRRSQVENRGPARAAHGRVDQVAGRQDEGIVRYDRLRVTAGGQSVVVDKVLASLGRRPNLDNMAIENAGIELDEQGIPAFNPTTMQIGDSHIMTFTNTVEIEDTHPGHTLHRQVQ